MGLFIGDVQPSKIFVGDTPISKVFLGDTQVRPSGWQPLNPICWYKFDGDYTDSTGNFGVASGTSSFQTLSSGVQVLQTDGTNLVSLPSGITANSISTYTIAFWMKPITTNPSYGYYAGCGNSNNTHISFYENTSGRDYVEWYGGHRDLTTSGVGAGWRMVCFRSNGSTCDLVVNGNNKTATTTAPSIFGYSPYNTFVLGAREEHTTGTGQRTSVQISNFVISNSYWDDTEVMGMYNATKDNYPQVGPSGWQPGANTLLYLPLESDVVDQSGKSGRTFTTNGLSYTTVGGVPSVHIGTTGGFKITQPYPFQPDNTKPLTFSFLFYVTTVQSSSRRLIADRGTTNYNRIWFALRENTPNIEFEIDYNNTNTVDLKSPIPSANAWHHAVFTCSTTAARMYIDGALTDSSSGVANPRGRRKYGHDNSQGMFCTRDVNSYVNALNGNARELIFEEAEWTAQEVANYYTRIKSKLGL